MTRPVPRIETAAQLKRAWTAGWLSWATGQDTCPFPDGSEQAANWWAARAAGTPTRGTVLPCRLHGLAQRDGQPAEARGRRGR